MITPPGGGTSHQVSSRPCSSSPGSGSSTWYRTGAVTRPITGRRQTESVSAGVKPTAHLGTHVPGREPIMASAHSNRPGSICLVTNDLDHVVRNSGIGTYYSLV